MIENLTKKFNNSSKRYGSLTLFFIMLCIYFPLKLTLPNGFILIPNIWSIILTVLLFPLINITSITKFFLVLNGFVLFNILFTYNSVINFSEVIKSSILLLQNMLLFYLIAKANYKIIPDKLNMALLYSIVMFILFYGILESNYSLFRNISDNFRGKFYNTSMLYDSDLRDIVIFGKIRPKVFTSEPSHAAFAVSSFILIIHIITSNKYKIIVSSGLLLISYKVIGSPFPFLFIAIVLIYQIFETENIKDYLRIILINIIILLITTLIVYYLLPTLFYRIELILQGKEGSFTTRTVNQFMFMLESLRQNIFFGLGLGSEDKIESYIMSFESNLSPTANAAIQSPIASIGIFMGLTGYAFFVGMIANIKKVKWEVLVVLICCFILLFFQGGSIVNTFSWITYGLLLKSTK